ncbi:MAG: nucleoside-diphosphate kinase [Chloroflexi bacterium]|nr:nucleoside-diphosphate kinase [Chloroflexota bacterium]
MERTLALIKPDGVQRALIGEIIARFERTGLKVVAMRMLQVDNTLALRHYAVHEGKPFFPGLIKYITSSPIVAIVLEGRQAVEVVRKIMGKTDGAVSPPGTIRGDLGTDLERNLVHGSDSATNAEKEINLFFKKEEILSYTRDVDRWITATKMSP